MTTKKTTTQQTYSITGKFELQVGVDVTATSMEDALSIANGFKVGDFVNFDGNEHLDSTTPEIIGIYKN